MGKDISAELMKRLALALCCGAALAAAEAGSPKDLELFLLIGQSNMAGRGVVEAQDREALPRVFALNEKLEWVAATDPLHFDKPAIAGVGLGRSFAQVLAAARPTASIGLIPAAFGGTSLDQWAPGGKHYGNAIARAREAMKSGRLRGILWHQGESDAGKEELARSYRERFAKLVSRLRADLQAPDLPVVVGQLGEFYQGALAGVVNEQLATVPLVVPHSGFVSSAGLQHKGDNTHFDSASLRELGRRYACAYLALDVAWAEPAGPAAATERRETPPDRKALSDATRISDPVARIAALEKWKATFPDSSLLDDADETIFSTLVKRLPEQRARILRMAKAQYAKAAADEKQGVAASLAGILLGSDQFLKEAEAYARRSVKGLNQAKYLSEQRRRSAQRKQKAPADEELAKRFAQMRAGRLSTLGRIYVKRGRTEPGRKLLEEAYAANPETVSAAAALGELAERAGDHAKALEYLTPARLSGRAPDSAMAAFDAAYRATHSGSLAGVEAALDSEYRRRFPNPVHVERYRPAAKRSGRLVLAEIFTGSGCPPCAGADVAFDAAMERYSRQELAVLMFHQHIPRPDPMTNSATEARAKFYDVRGVPTFVLDGKPAGGGGSRADAPEIYGKFNPDIEKDLALPAGADLKLEGALAGGVVKVRAAVSGVPGGAKDVKLHLALVEKELRYSGENGVRFHPMVVRALATFPVAAAGGSSSHTFDLNAIAGALKKDLDDYESKGHRGESFKFREKKDRIDTADVAVVAFVQDDLTKQVLQAAWLDLAAGRPAPATE
jgi:hypothetical protein